MPVILVRSDPLYLSAVFLSLFLTTMAASHLAQTVSWEQAYRFRLHATLNLTGLFLMTIGILEQNQLYVHVTLQFSAGVLFFTAYGFEYSQKEMKAAKTGSPSAKHLGVGTGVNGETELVRVCHVWCGYFALLCWLTQILGGLMKFGKLPEKAVRWHGRLAKYLFTLCCLAPGFASFISLRSSRNVVGESSTTAMGGRGAIIPLEFCFAAGFGALAVVVPAAVARGERRIENETSDVQRLRSVVGAGSSST